MVMGFFKCTQEHPRTVSSLALVTYLNIDKMNWQKCLQRHSGIFSSHHHNVYICYCEWNVMTTINWCGIIFFTFESSIIIIFAFQLLPRSGVQMFFQPFFPSSHQKILLYLLYIKLHPLNLSITFIHMPVITVYLKASLYSQQEETQWDAEFVTRNKFCNNCCHYNYYRELLLLWPANSTL